MTDVVSEVKEIVVEKESVVEKEIEKPEEENAVKEDVEKNGDAKDKEETENGEVVEKVENGSVTENGLPVDDVKDTKAEVEVCGIKRKSEGGLESSEDATVEITESKKQKVEETVEPEVASNGVC